IIPALHHDKSLPLCHLSPMKIFPLIAFDLDGTLANTEAISIPSAVATMRAFGVPVTLEFWYENLHGLTGESLTRAVRQHFGIEVSTQAYVQRRMEQVPEMFE